MKKLLKSKLLTSEFHTGHLAAVALMVGTLILTGCGGGGGRDPILGGGGTAVLASPQVTAVTPQVDATGVPVNTAVVTASFSRSMDAASISATTFSLACPAGNPVTGAVTYTESGHLATLTLNNNLPGNTTCTATVSAAVKDATGNTLASPYTWNFTTGVASEMIPPTVSSVVPAINATDVALNHSLIASFSEDMNPATMIAANFSLVCPVGTVITGMADYTVSGNVLSLNPSANLPINTVCRATVSTGARDAAGNAMAAPFIWNFTTGTTVDTTPPTVLSTLPRTDATQVPVNSLISAKFSEAMTPSTITNANFTVECPASTAISGTVAYAVNGNVATFTPNADLPTNTVCRATVTTGVKDLADLPLATDYTWNFTTSPAADTTRPTVSSTVPIRNATAVPVNTLVTASFSEAMNPLTITTANYTVACPVGTPIVGTVGYTVDGNVAVFTRTGQLPANTTCRATITAGVKDVAGNTMLNPYTWDFQTGISIDTTAPNVIETLPLSNATNVPLNTAVTARFSEAMDPLSITAPSTFLVDCPIGSSVSGIVSYAVNSHTAAFTSGSPLPVSTVCRATVNNTVTDLAGNPMVNTYLWNFTTGAAPDVEPPTVIVRNPLNGATNVPLNTAVNATFSEAMDSLTMLTANFELAEGLNDIAGQVVYDPMSHIATFTPDSALSPGTTYQFTVLNAVKDVAGNNMVLSDQWSFSTGSGLAPGAASLGTAATFGIMATSATTSTGATQVNGDVSLEPGTSQGIPPVQVNGSIHVNDATSSLARQDLLTAYNELKNLPPGTTILGGTDLGASYPGAGGIPPGTYTSGSTMLVSTPLTLNGGGNANAVWVFQIGSSLTTTADVLLSNGAQAKNVFWVPTADATIGVGTTFNGNIVAGRDTTTGTGVTINGRLLSGAITAGTIALDSTTVNVPAP